MFASEQRLLGHRVMHGFRRGRDYDGVDVVVFHESVVIRGRRGRLGFVRDFLQACLFDFGDVQFAHVGARGASFRANAPAPTCSDNSNVDLLHNSSTPWPAIQEIGNPDVDASRSPNQAYMLADFRFWARHITTNMNVY